MKKLSFYNLFYIFIIGSVFGWIVECIYTLIKKGIFLNHSALVIGPFNIVYGIGACFLTILLFKMKDASYWRIFIVGLIGGSIIEYVMSLGMELITGFTAWDYSRYFLNINGRICLQYSIYWGILSILWIKLCYPYVTKLIEKINYSFGKKLMIFLIVFLIFDAILTISAVNRAHASDRGIAPQNKYEEILDKTFNRDYLKNMFNNKWK